MAKKKSVKRKSKARTRKTGVRRVIRNTASEVIDEVEKASDVVLKEIRDSFDFLTGKITDTAKYAAKTTRAVRTKVTGTETAKHLQGLLQEVEDAGESLLHVIGGRLESLKATVTSGGPTKGGPGKRAPARKKKAVTRKKAAVKKKVTTRKKAAVKKKAATRKKAAAKKKAATRKKAAAKKKAATRKKTVARKRVARRKATARKAA